MTHGNVAQRAVAEGIGTALLLVAIIGSGIMGERLAGGNVAIALLANSFATAGALIALILIFGPVSGAHFNPVVTLALVWRRELPWRDAPLYLAAQMVGALVGVGIAHAMFGLPLLQLSRHIRSGPAQIFSEGVATFGLLLTILACARFRPLAVPYAVAAYIGAAYWFTASTSFANPAVTLARAFTDTFSGIVLGNTPGFILAQIIGAVCATALFSWLVARRDLPSV